MIRFVLFGVPVHIHLSFWVAALAWGAALTALEPSPLGVLFFALAAFVCLLSHEVGHALAARLAVGDDVGLCLSWMGGACCSETEQPKCSPSRGIIISMAGPLAGLMPALLLFAALLLMPGVQEPGKLMLRMLQGQVPMEYASSCPALLLLFGVYLVQISVWWTALNLLPLFPLDMGFVVHELMGSSCLAHIISIVATCLLSLFFFAWGVWALALLMLVFAYYNYRCILDHIE